MARVTDFRFIEFDSEKLLRSGKYIGHRTYWKLYAIENIFRVIIHSVLSPEIPQGWWDVAVEQQVRKKAESFKSSYLKRAWHGKPGSHDIYYVDLKDLAEIIRANSNLFITVIPDIDKWMVGIEDLRLPRNVIAHMNFPSDNDLKRIDVFHSDCLMLIKGVQAKIPILIP
ncbi:MAG: hypothetical protein HY961_10960 [Ignavibacteriae bacterium]|nr:hypothetical protein [Ignavibacteriota bacterium]